MTIPRAPITADLAELIGDVTTHPCLVLDASDTITNLPEHFPYTVLYPIHSTVESDYGLGDAHCYEVFHYDAVVFGERTDQVETVQDLVVEAVIDLTGGVPTHAWPSSEPSQRRYLGRVAAESTEDRKIVRGSVEVAIAQLV